MDSPTTSSREGGFIFINGPLTRVAIYNVGRPRGCRPTSASTPVALVQGHIYASLDPAQDYAIKSLDPRHLQLHTRHTAPKSPSGACPATPPTTSFATIPQTQEGSVVTGAPSARRRSAPCSPTRWTAASTTAAPASASTPTPTPANFTPAGKAANPPTSTAANDPRFRFKPDINLQPTDRHAGAPTGLDVHLECPSATTKSKKPANCTRRTALCRGSPRRRSRRR